MFYRVLAALVAVALIYSLYEVIATEHHYSILHTPPAPFMAINNESGKIPVVQYIDLRCGECKKAANLMIDYAEKNPDILYILRPIHSGGEERFVEVVLLIGAGMQGRYFDAIRIMGEYDGNPGDAFYEENASLIDLDIDRLKQDVNGEEIGKFIERNDRAIAASGIETTQSLMVGRQLYYLEAPLTQQDIISMVENERQKR